MATKKKPAIHVRKGTPWHGEGKSTTRTYCGRTLDITKTVADRKDATCENCRWHADPGAAGRELLDGRAGPFVPKVPAPAAPVSELEDLREGNRDPYPATAADWPAQKGGGPQMYTTPAEGSRCPAIERELGRLFDA